MQRVVGSRVMMLLGLLTAVTGLSQEGVTTLLQVSATNGLSRADLAWMSEADTFYEIYSTTNLATGPWVLAVADPLCSTNLVGQMALLSADKSRFFQVRKLDTRGPAITARYPDIGSANVGAEEPLTVSLSDSSGVDTNTIRVTIDGGSPLSLTAAGVTVTADSFTFDPALASTNWGAAGSTVTVSFACADFKGNATFAEWPFYLASPVVVAENILVLGDTAAQSYAVVRPNAGIGLLSTGAKPGVRPLSSGLSIVAIYDDRVVVAYTGDTHGIALGALLANNDYDNLFYRRVTGLSDNPSAKQVMVYTEDVAFTQLITGGSFDSRDFVVVAGQSLSALDSTPLATVGLTKTFAADGTYSITPDWGPVAFSGSASYALDGGMDFSTQVESHKIRQLTAGVYAGLDLVLDGDLVFDVATEPVDVSMALIEDLRLVRIAGTVYGIPVVAYLYLDLDLCVEAESSCSVALAAGAESHASFTNRVTFSGGTWRREPETGAVKLTFAYDPPTLSGGMEGNAYVYLKPTLTLRLYNAVGVGLDYRRGPLVTGSYTASDGRFQFCLYDKRSVNLSLWCTDLPDVLEGVIDPDDLPEWNLWTAPDDLKKTWYWPEVPLSAPSFTLQPSGGTYASGALVTLSASACGNPMPTCQWYQNGAALPGKTAATLSFTMGSSAVGVYTCKAANSRGMATSQSASVSLSSSVPTGMALIPAGSFSMGDNLDRSVPAQPVHTVYVSAFYMDKTEVTKAKWDEVYAWAVANGYSFYDAGSGKASGHPVHTVCWEDCLRWCNARSQKEGLTPCYTDTRGGTTYKTVMSYGPDCSWTANGYRLPTEAEWEKAARGGLSGRRFPWGATINHNYANYKACCSAYTYDTSPYKTATFHPTYYDGTAPFTSLAGAFAANGYGLYDMEGNVWEWCWDWYGSTYYSSSPSRDPRGPSSDSPFAAGRVKRGGSWCYGAYQCRVANRNGSTGHCNDIGFRPVRRAP